MTGMHFSRIAWTNQLCKGALAVQDPYIWPDPSSTTHQWLPSLYLACAFLRRCINLDPRQLRDTCWLSTQQPFQNIRRTNQPSFVVE